MQFGINVFDFGAKGDGVTDDTAAIQAAINFAAERGGGKILFPYTNKGYRIASPGIEEYDGMKVRAHHSILRHISFDRNLVDLLDIARSLIRLDNRHKHAVKRIPVLRLALDEHIVKRCRHH